MNLRSSLRALALASVCALPLPAGILTFNFTETGGDVVVTASGSITGITNTAVWDVMALNTTVASSFIDPYQGTLDFGGTSNADVFFPKVSPTSGNWTSGFGPGTSPGTSSQTTATSSGGDTLGFSAYFPGFGVPYLALPINYSIGTALSSTMTFTGATFNSLGITPVAQSVTFGVDTIQLTFGSGGGSGGGSSVPDAGPGPALALLLGGLGLRQWRSSRRARAAT